MTSTNYSTPFNTNNEETTLPNEETSLHNEETTLHNEETTLHNEETEHSNNKRIHFLKLVFYLSIYLYNCF